MQSSISSEFVLESISVYFWNLMCTREHLGYRIQTAYASVTYLDRFLSKRSIAEGKSWAVRLLAMACLSLAAKYEETAAPPGLSHLCSEDYNFECTVILRMELLVLATLEWRMGLISPFAFIQFFGRKFSDKFSPRNHAEKTVGIIMSAVRDVEIMSHRPSVIAAAATLAVLDRDLTRDALQLKISSLTSSGSFQSEDILSCYYQFMEMGIESHDLNRVDPNETSSVTSMDTAKRKRQMLDKGDVPEKKGKP
ncbi:cyclin-D5-1-like isoform X2 [Andrographis paniculata]|uniref:cyclin-D5-1-like isoform X2 n=1 Tax=Andrographis paniculata TaxID=175694 RepID=UPI0021E8740D|nr:cyclin-D5-1-like isoform X2 [Andrographis paniculata]